MNEHGIRQIEVIDSHTGGEPTRVLLDDPGLEGGTMQEKRGAFARDYGWLRTATICEPRGHSAIVGALLTDPVTPGSVAGVIFFNNVGCLNGCVHGTIGVAVTLHALGRIGAGIHRLDTPAGVVSVEVGAQGSVSVRNVRSYRFREEVELVLESGEEVTGDIAWGGNWFFLADAPPEIPLALESVDPLTGYACSIREALERDGITGENGGEIDHIELFAPPSDPRLSESRNFVLCPGKEYDRSPCGTGTSAKLACLHANGLLRPGQVWRQQGIVGSVFSGTVEPAGEGGVYPTVTGAAFVTGKSTLQLDSNDPFVHGI